MTRKKNEEPEIEEFPILFIQNKFQEAMRFLIHHGYRPKNSDQAMGIRILAETQGKKELAQAAKRVEQYASIVDDFSED